MTELMKPESIWQFRETKIPKVEFTDGKDLPLARALAWANDTQAKAKQLAEELRGDPGLTDHPERGRPHAFTERLATERIEAARKHLAAVEAEAEEVMAETEAAFREPELTPISAIERHEDLLLAQKYGELPNEKKLQVLEAVMCGKDPRMQRVLARQHSMITGLGEPIIQLLREREKGDRVHPELRESLKARAQRIGTVKRAVEAVLDALEEASDRTQLKAKGLAKLRLRDMDDAAKTKFIGDHGLAAFKELPR